MKPPQSYSFRSIYSRVRTKITQYYSFRSIYPRVRTKITTKQIHINNIQSNTKNFKECPKISTGETKNVHQPLCIDYPNVTSGIRKLSAKTYIKWINTIPHCHHEYSIARHIWSVLKSIKVFNPITTKSQREKLNSSQQDGKGKTPYGPTILMKPAIHQDRGISRTRERERERD